MSYPKELTARKLNDVNTKYLSDEIIRRYNSHELLCNEIERLQLELDDNIFYKRVYAGVGILSMLTIFILILVNHA